MSVMQRTHAAVLLIAFWIGLSVPADCAEESGMHSGGLDRAFPVTNTFRWPIREGALRLSFESHDVHKIKSSTPAS